MPLVALLTDFGTADTYAGQMKGALLGRCPRARVVDVTHEIPRGDVRAAAFALLESLGAFPRGTVFACVVDPAVGTDQLRLAVRAGGKYFAAPDNGLLAPAIERLGSFAARRLSTRGASSTFHGRDVFAPAAAHLAAGRSFSKLGPAVRDLAPLDWPGARSTPRGLRGEVIHVDRFGNLVTNLRPEQLPAGEPVFGVGRKRVRGMKRAYGEVRRGALLVLVGSHGFVEVAAREASAARRLGARRGTPVTVRRG
jgi:S-adenosylmethionine hydrolase